MPIDLSALLEPRHTALLLMECQEGIIGEGGKLGALAEAVQRHGTVGHIGRVLAAARARGVAVFHCTMARRPDGAGAMTNCLLLAATRKSPTPLVPGSPQQKPVAALAPVDGDWVLERYHGISPFHATELDQLLRNLGIKTVVACGVSVNIGILAITLDAVNAGYQVVIPREAVTGTPDEYVAAVMEHTLRLLATITTVAQVEEVWRG
ncbi:MAG TPA: cysteine hydrolase [Candidatus Binatia bacterium]|jgi:nicotinamidase-related amidase|nr:cysteine hydrolase [Candidatus Binatia bacterium]